MAIENPRTQRPKQSHQISPPVERLYVLRHGGIKSAQAKEHTLAIKFRLPIVGDDDFGDGEIMIGGFDKGVTLPPFKATPQSPTWPNSAADPRRCL